MSNVFIMLPVEDEELPVLLQALRERIAVETVVIQGTTKESERRQRIEALAVLRRVISRGERQVNRIAANMLLADEGQVPA